MCEVAPESAHHLRLKVDGKVLSELGEEFAFPENSMMLGELRTL